MPDINDAIQGEEHQMLKKMLQFIHTNNRVLMMVPLLQLLPIVALACGTYYGVRFATYYQQKDRSWYMRPEGKNKCVSGRSDRL